MPKDILEAIKKLRRVISDDTNWEIVNSGYMKEYTSEELEIINRERKELRERLYGSESSTNSGSDDLS